MNNFLYFIICVLVFYAGLWSADKGLTLERAVAPFRFLFNKLLSILRRKKEQTYDRDTNIDQTPRI